MEKLGLNQIRDMFLEFYESKEHFRKNSFSLVPEKDKSLLLINSGMAPLKAYFAGVEEPPSRRMTTCQKCIRTGDIENVGLTARHGTFFEMLGNFSFGDYFKVESLQWGWEFITKVLNMPVDKLWATIYEDDDEAFDIWKNVIGLPSERIVRLGKDDNFWEIGTGPCGPCSEIYFDRGEEYGCDCHDCKPGCDCDRYVEFWNHVFTQFSKEEDGSYSKLAHPNIDTGMGLERLACIMQGVDSIFDIDTIKYILEGVVEKSGIQYGDGKFKTDVSIRIITDHIRSVSFMIADGIIPSNEGRGYVLRRLLRRAARHGKLLNIEGAFLAEIADRVVKMSGKAYPELEEKRDYIKKIISIEEEKFSDTIDQGTSIIHGYVDELKAQGKTELDGEAVFKLYDTYGFPLELTQEILAENGCSADIEGFNEHMKIQRETARAARKSHDDEGWADDNMNSSFDTQTEFTGYQTMKDQGTVKAIINATGTVSEASAPDEVKIVLDKTPFYAESGGQIFDIGLMEKDGFKAEVLEVVKSKGNILHKIKIVEGSIKQEDKLTLAVDIVNRHHVARNHTATHLLHKALKVVVGDHIQQAGSSVTAGGLRFDFNHFEAVSKEDLQRIEDLVNLQIMMFLPVQTELMSIDEATKAGATALFGEKYGDTVRVVSIGDFSKELCGGTHLSNSGLVGSFKIVSEAGVAAGIRRIEAITGLAVSNLLIENERLIKDVSDVLKTNVNGLLNKVQSISEELKNTKKELDDLKKDAINSSISDIVKDAEDFNGVKLIAKEFKDYNINDLRQISDDIKAENTKCVMVFVANNGEKANIMVSVTDDLLEKGFHAGNMIKEIAAAAGGGGGGKADMAQAGAKDLGKIPEALKLARNLVVEKSK